jgi:hypothetical protein
MLVNHKYKFTFTHIPKCGGTWVRKTLLENLQGTREETFGSDGHIGVHASPNKYDDYKCLVSIRDPLSLYVSLFIHICRGATWGDAQEWVGFSRKEIAHGTHIYDLEEKKKLFRAWLPKIVSLDINEDCWDSPCMNDTGSTTKYIRFMKDHRKDFGWCTYTLIYNSVRDWEDFIKNKTLDEFFDYTNANYILKQHSLAHDLNHFLTCHADVPSQISHTVCTRSAANVRSELLDPDVLHQVFVYGELDYYNVYNHQEHREWYTPELIELVKKKEAFIYQLLEDEKVNDRF